MAATDYFTDDLYTSSLAQLQRSDACGNITIGRNAAATADKYSVRVLTGMDNKAIIDICGDHTVTS